MMLLLLFSSRTFLNTLKSSGYYAGARPKYTVWRL